MKRKVKFIKTYTDPKGNVHSIIVYAKDDVSWGNKVFSSVEEAKAYIDANC